MVSSAARRESLVSILVTESRNAMKYLNLRGSVSLRESGTTMVSLGEMVAVLSVPAVMDVSAGNRNAAVSSAEAMLSPNEMVVSAGDNAVESTSVRKRES